MSIIKIDLSAGGLSDEILATLLKLGVEVFFISTIVIGIYITLKHSDRQVYQNTVKELYKFCDLTEVRIQTEKDLVNLAMLLEEQKKHTQILKKYPAKAGAFLKDFAINSLTPILKETFEEAISSFFAPSIDEMRETIVKLSQYAIKSQQSGTRKMVDEFMKKLSTATKEHLISAENNIITLSKFARGMGENLRIHMDQMQKIIVMHKELSENSWAIVKNMSENHDEVLNSNREMIRVLEKTSILADSISDILKANGEMMDKLNQEKLSLQNENNQYFDNMNEQNRKLNEELNFRTNDIFMRFTDITENVINKFDENMGRAIGSFEENIKLTIGSLDEQSRNISLYANELSTDIGELNNNLNNSAKVFGDNIHEGVVKTFDDFDNGLAEICERLGTTINSIKDMTEYLPEMLKIFTVEIKKLRDN